MSRSPVTEWAEPRQWQRALQQGGVFLDVRAPVEFHDGALPGAINMPLLNDEERAEVGICYKSQGPHAAVLLGHSLVNGALKERRVAAWRELAGRNRQLILYCFRGGQRSAIAQQWLREAGVEVPRIAGGYKEVRRYLLSLLEALPGKLRFMSLSGHTGSGKTRVLRQLKDSPRCRIIDLENLANHRGSAFGKEISHQPAQAQFENDLAVELARALNSPEQPVWLEDEARTIGRITLQEKMFSAMRSCPIALIEEPRDSRARLILDEYVIDAYRARQLRGPETAWRDLEESLTEPISRISPKLGGAGASEAMRMIRMAVNASRDTGDFTRHLEWIEYLLEHYYDAFYERHMERQSGRIVFRGSRSDVENFILEYR
jgi:tRNA 2-selenouridine synthase